MSSSFLLNRAAYLLRHGGVVAYPTEAVFGLGAHPANAAAAERILAIKHRSRHKGVILLAAHRDQLTHWVADLPAEAWQQIESVWPGPFTWVLPARAGTPDWITGGRTEIAVRVSAHPVARALAQAAGTAIISTSANPSGHRPARSPLSVRRYFPRELDAILSGPVDPRANPTPIRHWPSGRWLRR
ncbi:L-threonylcarbamoyladenylate synthase [Halothiobacillus sp. DCM-1]|uniref:L-threonylcarbamoyladenylate synthase n=1 Tax=Halothiobacillus sp. DCM-1 TaxID=3112558 RepID=UPI0032479B1D